MRNFRIKLSKPIPRWPTMKELFRFFQYVTPGPQPTKLKGRCWTWTGYCDEKGYGQFRFANTIQWAHRFSYQAFNRKKLKPGQEADHLCRNPSCVNPAHLQREGKTSNTAKGNTDRKTVPQFEEAPF